MIYWRRSVVWAQQLRSRLSAELIQMRCITDEASQPPSAAH